jgi:hypothetical protein
MSGSPIYIGERLLGALASTFPFASEPMGMVTPIEAILRPDSPGTLPTVGSSLPMTGTALGFDTDALALMNTGLPTGITFSAGGRGNAPVDLSPGHVAAAVMVDGDWVLAILGTVTWRSGERIAAFGHQLFGLGMVDFPLAGGSVVATLPNRALAFKMSNPGPVIGSISYDGTSGVTGRLGRAASTLPLRINVSSHHARTFDLNLAIHPALTPLLLRMCVLNCGGMLGVSGTNAAYARLTMSFAGGPARTMERAATGAGAFAQISEELGGVLDAVMNCPLGRVVPESLVIDVGARADRLTYYLESVVVEDANGALPRDARVTVRFITPDSVPVMREARLCLPGGPGALMRRLEVGDAASASQWERERSALAHMPADADQYLSELFSRWMPNRLYLRVVTDETGWSRRDGEVSQLPPAMSRVLGRAAQRGRHDLTRMSVVARAEIVMDGPVYGSAIVDLAPSKEGRGL